MFLVAGSDAVPGAVPGGIPDGAWPELDGNGGLVAEPNYFTNLHRVLPRVAQGQRRMRGGQSLSLSPNIKETIHILFLFLLEEKLHVFN